MAYIIYDKKSKKEVAKATNKIQLDLLFKRIDKNNYIIKKIK